MFPSLKFSVSDLGWSFLDSELELSGFDSEFSFLDSELMLLETESEFLKPKILVFKTDLEYLDSHSACFDSTKSSFVVLESEFLELKVSVFGPEWEFSDSDSGLSKSVFFGFGVPRSLPTVAAKN